MWWMEEGLLPVKSGNAVHATVTHRTLPIFECWTINNVLKPIKCCAIMINIVFVTAI